jgi:zinc transporter 1
MFRLLVMLVLTIIFFFIEIIVGNITNSVALIADAFHMLSDVISLIIAIIAVRISKRRSDINTYGWVRAEIVGANINTVFLLALSFSIVMSAIKRFFKPEIIQKVDLLLLVGCLGLAMNISGLFLFQGFHGHSHGGMSHGHSHGTKSDRDSHDSSSHGHSHDSSSHGHSHDDDAHGHSHADDSHGHSHGDNSHGHSHDDDSHGHSHSHTEAKPKDNVDMDDTDAEGEVSNRFETHTTRALQEVRFK